MRLLAATLLALTLPATAQAQFTQQAMPQTGYRTPPAQGPSGTRQPAIDRRRDERLPTPPVVGRASPGFVTIGNELDRARRDIDRRRDSGELSSAEARSLRREVGRIDAMADRYRRDGLTEFERRELELRASELRNRTATGRSA